MFCWFTLPRHTCRLQKHPCRCSTIKKPTERLLTDELTSGILWFHTERHDEAVSADTDDTVLCRAHLWYVWRYQPWCIIITVYPSVDIIVLSWAVLAPRVDDTLPSACYQVTQTAFWGYRQPCVVFHCGVLLTMSLHDLCFQTVTLFPYDMVMQCFSSSFGKARTCTARWLLWHAACLTRLGSKILY